MTPRERAIEIAETSGEMVSFKVQAMIEKTIIAAIKAEREACAKKLDDHKPVPVFAVMSYHDWEDEEGNGNHDTVYMLASRLIRALPGKTEETEGKEG